MDIWIAVVCTVIWYKDREMVTTIIRIHREKKRRDRIIYYVFLGESEKKFGDQKDCIMACVPKKYK